MREKIRNMLADKNFSFVLKGSLSTAVTLFFVQSLRFLSGILIARYYGATASGRLTLIVTVMGILAVFVNFGVKEALQKILPEYRERYNLRTAYSVFRKANGLIILFSIIAGIVLYSIAPALCAYWNEPDMLILFRISALFLPFLVLGELNYFSLRALLKVHTANISLVAPIVIRLLVLFFVTYYAFNNDNPIYLHWSTLCILPWLFSLIPIYRNFTRASRGEKLLQDSNSKDILSIAYPMFLTYAAFIVTNSADVFILKAYHIGTGQVGIYKTCTNISMLSATMLVALNTTVQPKITQLHTQGNYAEVQRIAQQSAKLIFLLSLPVFVVLICFSKSVLWLYGDAFKAGAFSLSVLTAGQVFNTACGPIAQLLNGTGYHQQFRNISLFGAGINILLNFLLIPTYGVVGAAYANAVSMMAWNIAGAVYIKRRLGYSIFYIPFISNRISA